MSSSFPYKHMRLWGSDLLSAFAVVVNREGELTKTVAAIASVIEAEKLKVKGREISALS